MSFEKKYLDRRNFSIGTLIASAVPVTALAKNRQYVDYPFIDYYGPDGQVKETLGHIRPTSQDFAKADLIIQRLLKLQGAYMKMKELSEMQDEGSTGEKFNERWARFFNPLISKFFNSFQYNKNEFPDDCTPWCAATLSWCLLSSKVIPPLNATSSQSFLTYGDGITDPREGDICVFAHVGGVGGHVGFWVPGGGNGHVNVLGANQAGQHAGATECGRRYPKSNISIKSFAIKGTELYLRSYRRINIGI